MRLMTIEHRYFRNRDTHTDFRVVIVRWHHRRWRSQPRRRQPAAAHLALAARIFTLREDFTHA